MRSFIMKWHQKGVPEGMSLSILFTRVRDKKECTRCMLLEAYIWNAPGSNKLNTFWVHSFLMHLEATY